MAKVDWIGFANIRLESHHKKEVKALELSDKEMLGFILEALDEGYQLSFSPDSENSAVVVALTGREEACVNAGYTMSQRHADPIVAFKALYFAHNVIANREKWEEAQEDWTAVDW